VTSHRLPTWAAVIVLVATAACGSKSASTGGRATATTAAGGPAATVTIKNIAFNPTTVTIEAGQSVIWRWQDSPTQHDVVGDGGLKSPLQSDGSYQHRFASAGTYHYHCTIHPTMKGVIEVTS
jgi:plastocyanin